MSYLAPRNRPSVLAFAGDSTMISGFAMSGSRTAGDRPADGEWVLDTPRDAKYLASLLARHARRDQRAASLRRLNHNDTEAEAADDAIAHWKPTRQRQRPVLGLGDDGARRGDRFRQLGMLGWIDAVQSRCHDGDRWSPPFQCAPMRRGIDATGQPADHDHPGLRQVARQPVGGAPAVRGRVPRADDSDHWLRWELPPDEKARRWVMDLLEPRRIAWIVEPNDFHPLSRYCSASATCACSMSVRSSRSAMVRATRWTRWTARPLSCSRSAAA